LACALGHKACREGFSVLYKRASRLFIDLAQARGEGRLPRLMSALERTRLLIIDDAEPSTVYDRAGMTVTALGIPHGEVPTLAYRVQTTGCRSYSALIKPEQIPRLSSSPRKRMS
jgi:hypothetical protein